MLKNKNIIYFAPGRWDSLWHDCQPLTLEFSRSNRVLYVEGRKHLRAALKHWQDDFVGLGKTWKPVLQNGLEQTDLTLYRFPKIAPISGRFPLSSASKWCRKTSLNGVLRQLGMSSPLVWINRPGMLDLLDEVPDASLKIYHVTDDFTSYENVSQAAKDKIREQEAQIFDKVDAVIIVSQNLFNRYRFLHRQSYLVPNGVDLSAYTRTADDEPLPAELSAIRAPRVGYIGLVGDKLNFDLLLNLAAQHPEWSLVFLGEVRVIQQREKLRTLSRLPNVHFLEAVSGDLVHRYVKGFQVGLMPYKLGNHADHISPLKMYEYLAAGLPVASVELPAAQEFAEYIHCTSDPLLFTDVVAAALSDNSPERQMARRELVENHSWEARVESISQIIEPLLANNNDAAAP